MEIKIENAPNLQQSDLSGSMGLLKDRLAFLPEFDNAARRKISTKKVHLSEAKMRMKRKAGSEKSTHPGMISSGCVDFAFMLFFLWWDEDA